MAACGQPEVIGQSELVCGEEDKEQLEEYLVG